MVIRQTEVDGVPTLIAPTTGPTHAGLVFRVGQADETLARRGLTHLLEHLVLHPLALADYHYNGTTGDVFTRFHLQGSVADIATFLTGVTRSLNDLDLARLETERSIVLTEESSRGSGPTSTLPLWRYGAQGHGLLGYSEWGVHAVTADELRAWAARWFTRENCALWIAGDDVPPGLRLDLPAGRRMPVPAPTSALPVTPAWFPGGSNATAVDAVIRRQAAGPVFAGVLERALFRGLRQEGGLSYTASTDYRVRGDGFAVVTGLADALPDKHEAVLGGFVEVLAALRVGRIEEADVAAVVGQASESLSSAEADPARLPGAVLDLLTGAPVRPSDEIVRELKGVTVDDVRAVATEAMGTALLMTPRARPADWAGYTAAPTTSDDRVEGTGYQAVDGDDDRLVIGPEGVSRIGTGDRAATVRFDACAVMLAHPDGARHLIGLDAIAVSIEPTLYRGVPPGVVDDRVPADRRVDLPARDPEDIPRPRPASAVSTSPPSSSPGSSSPGSSSPPSSGSAARRKATVVALALLTTVVGGVALVLTIGMATGAFEPRVLAILGTWIIAGYLGKKFLAAWRE